MGRDQPEVLPAWLAIEGYVNDDNERHNSGWHFR